MAELVKIGNSQGVRIPKALIGQAHLSGKPLVFKVVDEGLLISPLRTVRAGWRESIEAVAAEHGQFALDGDWLDLPLDSKEWVWDEAE